MRESFADMTFIYFVIIADHTWQRAIYICGQTLKDYSKTCVKRPLKNRQNKDLNDKW